ncbi:MAG TPA: hypothetical protein VL156_17910 [Terriglobales bacterium]|nr:hypothetical protein [Terriglobales bacterium]
MRTQLLAMMQREFPQDSFTLGRELQHDFSPVFRAAFTAYEPSGFKPVHQFYGAVMVNLQPFGDFCDPRPDIQGQSFDGQQKLVLAWFKTGIARSTLAEAQKTADLVSEFS